MFPGFAHDDDEDEPDVEDVREAGLEGDAVVLGGVGEVPLEPRGPADEAVGEELHREDDGGGGAHEARGVDPAAVGKGRVRGVGGQGTRRGCEGVERERGVRLEVDWGPGLSSRSGRDSKDYDRVSTGGALFGRRFGCVLSSSRREESPYPHKAGAQARGWPPTPQVTHLLQYLSQNVPMSSWSYHHFCVNCVGVHVITPLIIRSARARRIERRRKARLDPLVAAVEGVALLGGAEVPRVAVVTRHCVVGAAAVVGGCGAGA